MRKAAARRLHVVPDTAPATPVVGDAVPDPLRHAIEAGEVILLLGRNSNAGGASGRGMAVANAFAAADVLAAAGVEVRHLLPPREVLTARLQEEAARTVYKDANPRGATRKDGKPTQFTLRSIVVPVTRQLVLVIQQGSGVRYDRTSGVQPAAQRVAEVVRDRRPVLIAAQESRSTTRDGYAWTPIVVALREQQDTRGRPVYYIDSRRPYFSTVDADLEDYLYREGALAHKEAALTAARMARGAREHTDTQARDGRFRYGFPAALPPPLAAVRLRNTGGLAGERWAYLDTPACRFAADEAATGFAIDGEEQGDQFALNRWLYRHLGKPGWGYIPCAAHLIANGFSTMAVRRLRQDPRAQPLFRSENAAADARRICRSVTVHSDPRHDLFHLTGQLWLPIGEDGSRRPLQVVPADWEPLCRPEDRARIDAFEHKDDPENPRPRVGPALLAGHPATIDGLDSWLIPVRPSDGGAPAYAFGVGSRHAQHRYDAPWIPHSDILRALQEAAEGTYLSPDLPGRDLEALTLAEERLAAAQAQHANATWEKDQAGKALDAAVLKGEALERVQDTFIEAAGRCTLAEDEVEAAERKLASLTVASGLPASAWFDLLVHLRDPRDDTYRELLQSHLGPVTAVTEHVPVPGGPGRIDLRWQTHLALLTQDGQEVALRLTGTVSRTVRGSGATTTDGVIVLMRAGTPLRDAGLRDAKRAARLVRQRLGHDPGMFCYLTNVEDPALLALGMAACHPEPDTPYLAASHGTARPPAPGPALDATALRRLAARQHVPIALLRRIQALHDQPPWHGAWRLCPAPEGAALLAEAATHPVPRPPAWLHPRVTDHLTAWGDGWGTRPCRRCGSRAAQHTRGDGPADA